MDLSDSEDYEYVHVEEESPVDYQELAGRNLYAGILLSAISDLSRYRNIWNIKASHHRKVRLYGHLARRWMTRKTSATVPLDTCLEMLKLDKKTFLKSLDDKDLLNPNMPLKPLLNYYELDPNPKTLPRARLHLSRTYDPNV